MWNRRLLQQFWKSSIKALKHKWTVYCVCIDQCTRCSMLNAHAPLWGQQKYSLSIFHLYTILHTKKAWNSEIVLKMARVMLWNPWICIHAYIIISLIIFHFQSTVTSSIMTSSQMIYSDDFEDICGNLWKKVHKKIKSSLNGEKLDHEYL